MERSEKEALNALIGITNQINAETIDRQERYFEPDASRAFQKFRDTQGSAESLIGKRRIAEYLDSVDHFFGDRKLSKEEMIRAQREANAAGGSAGYGFAGFVDDYNPTEEEKKKMDAIAMRQSAEIEEIKKEQKEMRSDLQKTNEALTKLVEILAVSMKSKSAEPTERNPDEINIDIEKVENHEKDI